MDNILFSAIVVLGLIVLLLWIFLPFAIFGFQKKLDEMMTLHKKTNHLLEEVIKHQAEMSGLEPEKPWYAKNVGNEKDPDQVIL